MLGFRGAVTGVTAASAGLRAVPTRLGDPLEVGVRRGVAASVGVIRGNASGRPGPRVITGDFRRSITGEVQRAGTSILASLGSNAAQARRLEEPFYGPDSLGRRFPGTTYPWLRPSIPEVESKIVREASAAVGGALQ